MWKNDPDRMDRMRQKLQFGADLWGPHTLVMEHDGTLLDTSGEFSVWVVAHPPYK